MKKRDRQNTENFRGCETILYNTTRIDPCHYNLSKSIECTPPRMNPNVNDGLWVIMMCQCRFINYNNCTPGNVGGMLIMKRLCMCDVWGKGACGKSIPFSQFYCEPETAVKNRIKKKLQLLLLFKFYINQIELQTTLAEGIQLSSQKYCFQSPNWTTKYRKQLSQILTVSCVLISPAQLACAHLEVFLHSAKHGTDLRNRHNEH